MTWRAVFLQRAFRCPSFDKLRMTFDKLRMTFDKLRIISGIGFLTGGVGIRQTEFYRTGRR